VATFLLPLLAQSGFAAYFSGHTHDYERGTANGVATFITGGGGGGLDEICRSLPEVQFTHIAHHHLLVEAGCTELTVSALELDGGPEPFDRLVIPASQ
jgi:hypothetical protein